MFVNKYNAKCKSCNDPISAGDGFAYKNGYKWFTVCNSTACIKRLGLTVPSLEAHKELCEDGRIIIEPFDFKMLDLIRAMPGARWQPDHPQGKCWVVSTKTKDLARIIEVSEKIGLDIPDSFKKRAAEGTAESREAKKRAETQGLYEFQRAGVEFLALRDSAKALLGDDQGTGKTVQTLVALPENPSALIVVPASLKYNWASETKKWRPDIEVIICNGRDSFKLPRKNQIIITNYDILPKYLFPKTDKQTKKKVWNIPHEELFSQLMSETILICDEAHVVKNYKTQRAAKVTKLAEMAKATWFLTGTPLLNRPFDLYGVLSSGGMAREALGGWNKFLDLFQGQKGKYGGYIFAGPKPEVPERMRRVMLRRLKKDVLQDLPPKQHQTIVVDLSGKIKKDLDSAMKEWEENYDKDELPPFKMFSSIRAKLAKDRIKAMLEIVSSYEEQETPLIVFSAHKMPIEELAKRDGWRIITGDISASERDEIKDEFQNGKLKGIGLTIKAGGVGLTLTHASDLLFVDLDWTPALNLQAEDRGHRIGQMAERVLIMHMVSKHPLDLHIHELIERKMELIRKAIEEKVEFTPRKQNAKTPKLRNETNEELKARLVALEEAAAEVDRQTARNKLASILERERGKTVIPEPELTYKRKALIRDALGYMISRCDGAIKRDGIGFNKPDAGIAHCVFRTGMREDDEITFRVIERVLSRYYTQVSSKYPEIWEPELS